MKGNLKAIIALVFGFTLISFNGVLAQDPGVKDTCIVERLYKVLPNSDVVLNIYLVNDEDIGGFTIPLIFPDSVTNLDITCDSISFVGTRAAGATYKSDQAICPECVDNAKNRVNIFALFVVGALTPGNVSTGPIAKLHFRTGSSWDSTLAVPVDTTLWPPISTYEFSLVSGDAIYPVFWKGALEVKEVNTPAKPTVYSLSQNYPNPFNPKTIIRFALPKDSWVKMEIYNILGQKVKTLIDEKLTAGLKEVEWDGKDDKGFESASGIYFYKIKADEFSDIKKMVMLK